MIPRLGLALCLGLWAGAAGAAELLCDTALEIPEVEAFGGLSAIEMAADGGHATLLSDRAALFRFELIRDGGCIAGARLIAATPLTDRAGRRPAGIRAMDTEGMARMPDGRLFLSFEGIPRVAHHGPDGRERYRLGPVPGATALPINGGFEGLAADAAGRLYTLAEGAPGTGPIPLYRHEGGAWRILAYLPRRRGFAPVGLDIDDAGRLYLLERSFSVLGGFASRLTRFDIGSGGLGPGEVLLRTPRGRHGNLEGLSLWRDAKGRLIASMIADDDFLPILQTAVVDYALPD